jgi:hypothetical protein
MIGPDTPRHEMTRQILEREAAQDSKKVEYPSGGHSSSHRHGVPGLFGRNPYESSAPPCVSPAVHRLARASFYCSNRVKDVVGYARINPLPVICHHGAECRKRLS